MSNDKGEQKSDPTAVIVYKAPNTPVPSFFAPEPPVVDMASAETPRIAPDADAGAKEAPSMPRAAKLGEPSGSADAGIGGTQAKPEVVAKDASRAGRFALLAACVSIAACLGALAGSLGVAPLRHALGAGAVPPRVEANEDVHALKDAVAQLRASLKTIGDNVAAVRASTAASSAGINAQLTKIAEAVDRTERAERRAAAPTPAAPETTGSIATSTADPKQVAKPPIVDGWVVRKVYDGAALIEGRYGIVEVEPGMMLPGLGRIQEIKRQDGHWVVVTPKGLIMPMH